MRVGTKYTVLRLILWGETSVKIGQQAFPIDVPASGIGYLPVYDCREKAEEDYPSSEIVEIHGA